jgi:hypothetical protein
LGDYLDASAETLAETITLLEAEPFGAEEKIILTGPGADLLLPLLPTALRERIVLDPARMRGRALELLELTAGNIVLYREDETAGPLYLRKSDAEESGA